MIVTRYFIYGISTEMYEYGFIPLWIPKSADFNGAELHTLLHDALEHKLTDTGTLEQELSAYGRVIALRCNPDSLSMRLAEDIVGMLELEDVTILEPIEPVYISDKYAAYKAAIKLLAQEVTETYASMNEEELSDSFTDRLEAWITYGFVDAVRRYGGIDNCTMLGKTVFHCSEDEFKRIKSNAILNDILKLTICTDTGNVKLKHIQNTNKKWARNRIYKWWES